MHGANGLGGAPRPLPTREPTPGNAATAIVEHAADDTFLVVLGPMTNVAAALDLDPSMPDRLAGIAFMGGAIATGNATPVAEFNVATDPEAAAFVLASGARLLMCGLDLTTQVRYDDGWADALARPYVAALLRHYLGRHRYGPPGAPLHDPCAVLAVTHPHLFSSTPRPVAVELDGTLTRGQTVVDRRPWSGEPNVEVVETVDADAVRALVTGAVAALRPASASEES